ncbi:hypothetical protein B7463_g10181, partial [Scytalidium lignicola]
MATNAKDFPDPNYNLSLEQVIEQTIQFLFPCQWANDFPAYSSFSQFVIDLEALNNKAFLLAAEQGNTALLPVIIGRPGFNAHSLAKNGCNALSLAAEQGETGAIEYLLTVPHINKNLYDLDKSTPLLRAVRNFHTAASITLLNDDEVDVDSVSLGFQTPLGLAVETNQKLIAQRIAQRISKSIYSPTKDRAWEIIYPAVKFDDLEFIKLFLSKYEFIDLLWSCPLVKGVHQLGQWLFSTLRKYHCLNLTDAGGSRLLTWAIERGLALLVMQLIDNPTTEVDFYDQEGETPLTQAVKRKHIGIIEQLVNRRQELHNILVMKRNIASERPLGIAITQHNIEAARLLIGTKEMEINNSCSLAFTPLEMALDLGDIDMMKLILPIKGVNTQFAFDMLGRKKIISLSDEYKINRMRDMLKEYLKSFPATDL